MALDIFSPGCHEVGFSLHILHTLLRIAVTLRIGESAALEPSQIILGTAELVVFRIPGL